MTLLEAFELAEKELTNQGKNFTRHELAVIALRLMENSQDDDY